MYFLFKQIKLSAMRNINLFESDSCVNELGLHSFFHVISHPFFSVFEPLTFVRNHFMSTVQHKEFNIKYTFTINFCFTS